VTKKGAGHYLVDGGGLDGLGEPADILDCGNSGTTARLLLGVLAGQPFWSVLTGDESLRRRPMGRVAEPLRRMGATIVGRDGGQRLPLCVGGTRPLKALAYRSPVASAQVKTALLLAGLWADGPVTVEEPALSRDHTERMLEGFGARLEIEPRRVTITPGGELRGQPVAVPGDISSAAFFLVAATIVSEAHVTIATALSVWTFGQSMGAEKTVADVERTITRVQPPLTWEPRLIDEVPVLAVAACAAAGVTRVRDAAELRVKESDRIHAIATELGRMGADIVELPDGLEIRGGRRLRGATVSSAGDHRIAMALVVAGLVADGSTVVDDTACIATSFPGFVQALNTLAGRPCAVTSS